MRLFLVQHAKATSKEVDPDRPLTEEGRRGIRKVAAFIKPLNVCVDSLWHSGKKRAAQTVEVLAEVVRVRTETTGRDGLAPNDDVAAVRDEVTSEQQDVMIVGHLPFLSKLASLVLTGNESANTVAFKKAGIVCLSCPSENQWQIDWMVTPELLV